MLLCRTAAPPRTRTAGGGGGRGSGAEANAEQLRASLGGCHPPADVLQLPDRRVLLRLDGQKVPYLARGGTLL